MNRVKVNRDENKKKKKRVMLGETMQESLEAGRVKCECQGIVHRLVNNCLYCG